MTGNSGRVVLVAVTLALLQGHQKTKRTLVLIARQPELRGSLYFIQVAIATALHGANWSTWVEPPSWNFGSRKSSAPELNCMA